MLTLSAPPPNERRWDLAWRQMRIGLAAMDSEDTWLDPLSSAGRALSLEPALSQRPAIG